MKKLRNLNAKIEKLYKNEALTPFQRVSIKAAFEEGSPTRQHIIGLNGKANLDAVLAVRRKYGNVNTDK